MKSKIREFAALGKLLAEFTRDIIDRFGLHILRIGSLEYVDSNTDIVLVSFRKDIVRQQTIISGLIPKKYQKRMLERDEARIKFSPNEFVDKISATLDPVQKAIVQQRIQSPTNNILALIKENINENGEFYIVIGNK